jgi:pyruvate dehydrogenase E1 component alpha subunit
MVQIPKHIIEGGKVREVTLTKDNLINFEKEVKQKYNDGEIKAPVHLSSNNEEQLIEIFQYVSDRDWVFSSWRNHYHALLHGIDSNTLMGDIVHGKSMSVNHFYSEDETQPPLNYQRKFYSTSIVGGGLPIALGVAKSIKLKNEKTIEDKLPKVWCFIGDMTFESGIFHEVYKYSRNNNLPIEFVIEDNNLSTNTPTEETWGKKQEVPEDVFYYQYKSDYPHHGTGTWVMF